MRRSRRFGAVTISALSLLVMFAAIAPAATGGRAGTPHPGFGKDGRVLTSVPKAWVEGSFSDVTAAAGGRLLVAYFAETDEETRIEAIERLEPNGVHDASFGKGGSVPVDASFGITVLAEDAAGGVLYGSLGRIERLEPDGSPDGRFDKAVGTLGEFLPEQIVVTPAGAIIVAGHYSGGTPNRPARADTAVMRFEADGKLDEGFGEKGVVSLGGTQEPAGGLGVLADGSILVLGPKVQRIAADGTIEPKPEVEPGADTNSMVAYPDGGFALATSPDGEAPPSCTVTRFRADGSLDPEFAQAGVFTRAGIACDEMVAAPEDGLLLLAGGDRHGEHPPALLRLTAEGAPVPGFGTEGIAPVEKPAAADPGEPASPALRAATVTADGRIVVAGGNRDAVLVGLEANGTPDPAFGAAGAVVRQMRTPSRTYVASMAAEPNGELIVTGATDSGQPRPKPFWMRFTAAGKLRQTASGAPFRVPVLSAQQLQTVGPRDLYSLSYPGHEYLVKWKSNGELARGFGHDGMARVPRALDASSYVIDADGGATIFGTHRESLKMAAYRVTAAGRPDQRFGAHGLVVVRFAGHERSRAVAGVRGPGGDVVLVGHHGDKLALVELGPRGHLQRKFGREGRVICGCGAGRPERVDMVAHRGALYVAVGATFAHPGRATLLKFTMAGAIDRSFGRRGHRWTDIGYPHALITRGRWLVAIGQRRSPLGPATIRAFRFDGAPDRSWGSGATVTGGERVGATEVSAAQAPRGPLVLAGEREGTTKADGNRLELLGLR